jgi:hypothetical protein
MVATGASVLVVWKLQCNWSGRKLKAESDDKTMANHPASRKREKR